LAKTTLCVTLLIAHHNRPVVVDADFFPQRPQFVETPATPQKEDEELLQLFSLKMLVGQLDSMITKKYAKPHPVGMVVPWAWLVFSYRGFTMCLPVNCFFIVADSFILIVQRY
jgi:hypothetical protein